MADSININTAGAKDLTQLPGIAKNVAYRIVNHRDRHGYFTRWGELLKVKEFPEDALPAIRRCANIDPPKGVLKEEFGPRRIERGHFEKAGKKPKGYAKTIRGRKIA